MKLEALKSILARRAFGESEESSALRQQIVRIGNTGVEQPVNMPRLSSVDLQKLTEAKVAELQAQLVEAEKKRIPLHSVSIILKSGGDFRFKECALETVADVEFLVINHDNQTNKKTVFVPVGEIETVTIENS